VVVGAAFATTNNLSFNTRQSHYVLQSKAQRVFPHKRKNEKQPLFHSNGKLFIRVKKKSERVFHLTAAQPKKQKWDSK